VTGIRELSHGSALSAAPAHVRVSVVGGRTQLDVALPADVPVASLLPELVRLVRSRDSKTSETSSDTPWPAARHTFWVLSRLAPATSLRPNETLRAAGVADGELLHLKEERALSAPTLYDDVVDAAARLNKAAYSGWNATAARWMSFAGLAAASLVWVYLLLNVTGGPHRLIIVGLAAVVVAAMVGGAALACRWYGQADIAAAAGWSTIPIVAAIVWALLSGFVGHFGAYGLAAGCAVLVILNVAWYSAIGTGPWGYLASGVLFAGCGLALLGHALGASACVVGVIVAVAAAVACLAVPALTGRLVVVEASAASPGRSDSDAAQPGALVFENPFAPPAASPAATGSGSSGGSGGSGGQDFSAPSFKAMPTAEAVWARARSAAVTGSALYAGLGATVFCAAVTVLRAGSHAHWAALVFVGICAATLGVYARVPGTALECVSLGVPAVALVVAGCVSAQGGTAAMAWAGFGTLFAVIVVALVMGLRGGPTAAGGNLPQRWVSDRVYLIYVQYTAFAALIPAALWAAGVYALLDIR
jgi:type VII secretion integral membrane protein EccD